MINWFRRRKYRNFIKQSFKVANLFIRDCNVDAVEELIEVFQDLLNDYCTKYGADDIYLHYSGRLEYFKYIKRYKEQDELLRRKIEE